MIWVVEEIPVSNRTFCTADGRIFGSFQPDDLRKMYHLPEPKKRYNKALLEKFANENEIESARLSSGDRITRSTNTNHQVSTL